MKIIGVICEYNPFHNGHIYQINKIKEMYPNCIIIVLVSSCFTQRGDVSVMNKWDKAYSILNYGVDMVLEFPFVYASQGADIFAKGAIEILNHMNIDTLVFGSECNDIDIIYNIANTQINNSLYDSKVREYMNTGINYPTAMSKALEFFGIPRIDNPNDLLGISYVKEIIKNNYNIDPICIKRTNDYLDNNICGSISSGTSIRKLINEDKDISMYVPNDIRYYKVNREMYFNLLKYNIINNINCLDKYNTVNEGIENKIKKVIFDCNSWEELVFKLKSKRYTYNKINRMLIHILTSLTKNENINVKVDYIRVLGFNKKGQEYLNSIKKTIGIPIVTKYRENLSLMFDIEYRINAIYESILGGNPTMEYRHNPIIKDNNI